MLRIKRGQMHGPDILELQIRLTELGYFSGKADGIYNENTEKAVICFQKESYLKPDGIVGSNTWKALEMNSSHYFSIKQAYDSSSIIIDINRKILVFVSDKFMKIYPVAVGRYTLPTPLGNWTIVNKSINPGGPFGARWMRLSVPWGGYGIHGTNNPKSIGKSISHGCVRMYNHDVIEVYNLAPIGTPVTIIGEAYANRVLKKGDRGSDVKGVQKMLRKLKFYRAKLDGYFGYYTEKAVSNFQKTHYLEPDGVVGAITLTALQKDYAAA